MYFHSYPPPLVLLTFPVKIPNPFWFFLNHPFKKKRKKKKTTFVVSQMLHQRSQNTWGLAQVLPTEKSLLGMYTARLLEKAPLCFGKKREKERH